MNTDDGSGRPGAVAVAEPVLPAGTQPGRTNNFNLLRWVFATLVILSHAYALIDGNNDREPLVRLFGTFSLGDMAVRGFFLLSGYLIVQSWDRNPHLPGFLRNRVLRIYPGFIVASLISAFLVGPIGTNAAHYFAQFDLRRYGISVLFLRAPAVPPSFDGWPFPSVNGSFWTISYEFRCYMLAGLGGCLGLVRRRWPWLLLSAALAVASVVPWALPRPRSPGAYNLLGDVPALMHLMAVFSGGACFYLIRDRIRYDSRWCLLAALVLLLSLFRKHALYLALPTAGAYLLFWFAFRQGPLLDRLRGLPDITYGVYLYAWPIQKLLLWFIPSLTPLSLFALAAALSCACGALSYYLVERPFLRRKSRASSPAAAAPPLPVPTPADG